MAVEPPVPERLLVVSANIGEGHNATARAVEERARRLWPACRIHRLDTLHEMGRWVGPGFRWIYRVNVDTTPWLYDFFYRALLRYRWFAASSCRVVGTWSGIRLAPVIARYRPDLVVSTYPLGTGGLDWIRRRGGLDVPVAAIVSDFAPHPFWVYPEVDLHYVASEPSRRAAHRVRPDARAAVGAPPVVSSFRPDDRAAARRRCGLPDPGVIVLICCGSFGFGSVERAVDAGLAADPQLCVVVVCGRNEALRARLLGRGEPARRLVPLGWTTEMPALITAADVVVNNAGGATALEAVACGRAVLMFEPIAGHGRANAELMAQAGLATVCPRPADLVAALRDLVRQPGRLAEAERRALAHVNALDLNADIAALPALSRHHGARALPAPDAFFAHAATPAVPQQVGALLLLDEQHPSARPPQLTGRLLDLVAARAAALPMLRYRLELRPGHRPRRLVEDTVDPARQVSTRTVDGRDPTAWSRAVREFFATPVPLDRPPWQLQALHDSGIGGTGGTGRSAVLAKLHHALGDGIAVTATLLGLLSDQPGPVAAPDAVSSQRPAPESTPEEVATWRSRAVRARRVLRGVLSLAAANAPPRAGRTGAPAAASTPHRTYAMVELPADAVRAVARRHRVSSTALLLGLLGEALHRHDPAGAGRDIGTDTGTDTDTGTGSGDRLPVMVPRTTRTVRRAGEAGNRTAAVRLDLPVGPMPLAQRTAAVAADLARSQRAGQPIAAQAVMNALGRLPAPVQARLARLMYGRRFFALIASVLPGSRSEHRLGGARVVSVFPVLPLADGVGLAVGFLTWGRMLGVGVSTDPALFGDGGGFAGVLERVFDEVMAGMPGTSAKE